MYVLMKVFIYSVMLYFYNSDEERRRYGRRHLPSPFFFSKCLGLDLNLPSQENKQ